MWEELEVYFDNCAYKIIDKEMVDVIIIFLALMKISLINDVL